MWVCSSFSQCHFNERILYMDCRYDVLASTILGQAKTAFQAEIDAVCELSDFYAFNVQWALVSDCVSDCCYSAVPGKRA